MTALRDWRRDHYWVTPPGCVQEYRAPPPQDFMRLADAAQLLREGDPFGLTAAEG